MTLFNTEFRLQSNRDSVSGLCPAPGAFGKRSTVKNTYLKEQSLEAEVPEMDDDTDCHKLINPTENECTENQRDDSSSDRVLRKRKVNLNRLASSISCPVVCQYQHCGVQLADYETLEVR